MIYILLIAIGLAPGGSSAVHITPKQYTERRYETECQERNIHKSHFSSKRHMIYISSNNGRHPVTNIFTPLHYTSPNYASLHFTTLVFENVTSI